ncbi:DNA phosphorothioation-associated putative methyltransferase [Streptomyces sp. TRM66268-LWL]|uniref:DNA phosphorothioation-associated putative methyltransferase n=1 Tax=Streptomyces polyasparticus TaxID=2767826 RepID=A0ABR7SQP9_9ACTN|nr:DNA phosphorothioation-associated putative methyltransferase [Streptomyces polyasparticus]MBC9717831.1 DNA phosphorothioation-associated putative methyltransferase [Streptomyces polyasparticus]
MQQTWNSDRRRTAIGRAVLSVPARQALADRQLTPDRTVLDYGCGRGDDVRALERLDCTIAGWDPYYRSDVRAEPSSVVLLTYVLNVIEDPAERRETLKRAWELAQTVLVVSARLTWEKSKVRGEAFGDGLLTSRQTFQHLYGASELRSYVEEVTGARVVSAAPGIVYAFKDDTARLGYLAQRIVPDAEWLASEDTASAITALVDYVERRGRPPRIDEMPRSTAELLAHLKPNELKRLVRDSADSDKVAAGAKHTTLNTLLYLAVELFNGRGPFSSLPSSVQLDVRAFFTSYKEACQRSDRLLLKLRDDTYIRGAMNASAIGKMTPTALYVHRRALDRMPTVLRLYEHCASIAAGRPQEWTVAKLKHQGRAVSWLDYPDFDKDPHPRIVSSYMVDLQSLETSHMSYAKSVNRPLLHRKHEFLAPDDPDVPRYVRLTDSELRAGLYTNPHLIGTENGWEAELIRCGRELRGHRLVRRSTD